MCLSPAKRECIQAHSIRAQRGQFTLTTPLDNATIRAVIGRTTLGTSLDGAVRGNGGTRSFVMHLHVLIWVIGVRDGKRSVVPLSLIHI